MSALTETLEAGAVNHPAVLTKQEAAEYLRVTPRYLERMVSSGRLLVFKPTAGIWRVSRKNLDAFLESAASIAA